ncbi:MAG: protein kinase [Myxococcota bacterium]
MSQAETIAPGNAVGRYVLHDEIASGGMAAVHLGRLLGPAGFSRTVAIKRLHPEHARDPEFVAMFLDEARLAARIQHPNVVPIVDVVALSGQLFLVMEYIQGESLSRLMRAAEKRGERVPQPIALAIMADALYGLHAAHEAKDERGEPLSIVHRDVSPHNILVGRDGAARVLDFGIAKAASRASTTQDGKVKGKFTYMAPEQLKRGPVDRRADVFAASIVLWEVLTGARLFAAEDLAGIVARVLNDVIEPPSARLPSISPALDAIVMKGLERAVERRYASALEMARDLEAHGGLARPAEVGAWVERISGDVLEKRALQVKEIESDSAGSVPLVGEVPFIPMAAPAGESTMQLMEPEGLTANMRAREEPAEPTTAMPVRAVDPAPPVRTRRRGAWAFGVAIAIGALSLAWFWWGGASAPTAVEAAPSPGLVAAPTAVGAAPSPSLVAVPSPEVPVAAPEARPAEVVPASPEPVQEDPAASAASKAQRPTRGRVHRAPVKAAPKVDCSPGYYFDAEGIKRFKPECI